MIGRPQCGLRTACVHAILTVHPATGAIWHFCRGTSSDLVPEGVLNVQLAVGHITAFGCLSDVCHLVLVADQFCLRLRLFVPQCVCVCFCYYYGCHACFLRAAGWAMQICAAASVASRA